MEHTPSGKAPWHLWVVGILTLLWNAVGASSYTMTQLGQLDSLGMTGDQIAYFNSFPAWANAVWALGVWGALLGSVLLLLRSRWSVTAFAVSIIGLIGTTFFEQFATEVPEDLSNPLLNIAIWVITLATLFYAIRMRQRGVLR